MADLIADDVIGPYGLLEGGEPLAVAFYPDHAIEAELIERMRDLAEPREVVEVRRGEDALPFVDRDALILVEPANEEETVVFFNRNRDHFDDAKARILLLLLRGGSGERALQDAPALASFARDASFEVLPWPTREESRAAFVKRYGVEPEEWRRQWREGELDDDMDNNFIRLEAAALVDES
jgi:hypothetical protein